MVANDDHTTGRDGEAQCTAAESFTDHGIDDGSRLIQRAYYRLSEAERSFRPTADYFARVESAFIWAYLGSTSDRGVPPHVEAALDDSRILTREEFIGRPDADLRTEVLPAFYRRLAAFHCAYRN